MLRYNKKGQIGETVSWMVATLVVIGILLIFIWVSVLMSSKTKNIGVGDLKTDLKESNLLSQKTSFANQLANNKNKEIIDNILKENG